eukprot:gene5252-6078_t
MFSYIPSLAYYLGLAILLRFLYRFAYYVYSVTIREPVNLKKTYGDWAVITGATDGIGKAYAHELAKKGMNIVLISRTMAKLNEEAQAIETKFKVQTKVIAFDFNTSDDAKYERLYASIGVPIGVLINNVGISYEHAMYVDELPNERIESLINMNIKSVTALTKLALPAGSKSFVEKFTTSAACEYANKGVFLQCITPGLVVSNMSKVRKPSLFIPMPATFARAAVSTIGHDRLTSAYWAHQIQTFLIEILPAFISDKLMYDMHIDQRKRALAKKNKAQ